MKNIIYIIIFLIASIVSGLLQQFGKGVHMGLYPDEYKVTVKIKQYDGEDVPLFLTPDYRCEEMAHECKQCNEISHSYCSNECAFLASDYCLAYEEEEGYIGLEEYIIKNK